jgi:hypothetical protein
MAGLPSLVQSATQAALAPKVDPAPAVSADPATPAEPASTVEPAILGKA